MSAPTPSPSGKTYSTGPSFSVDQEWLNALFTSVDHEICVEPITLTHVEELVRGLEHQRKAAMTELVSAERALERLRVQNRELRRAEGSL